MVNVTIYTSTMDPMGISARRLLAFSRIIRISWSSAGWLRGCVFGWSKTSKSWKINGKSMETHPKSWKINGKSCGITENIRLIDADQCWQRWQRCKKKKRLVGRWFFLWMVQWCLGLGKTEGKLAQLTHKQVKNLWKAHPAQGSCSTIGELAKTRSIRRPRWWDHGNPGESRESQESQGIPANSHANSESNQHEMTRNFNMLWTFNKFSYAQPERIWKKSHSATWHDAMAHVSICFARFAGNTLWQSSGTVPQRRNPSQRPTLRGEFRRRGFPHSHVDLQLVFSGTRLNHCATADWRSFRPVGGLEHFSFFH